MGERSEIRHDGPQRDGDGSTRRWSRTIQGRQYSFTAVLMPDGERRYFASRFNGYPGGPQFGCAWDRASEMTIRADGSTRSRRFAPRTDHYWTRTPTRSRATR